MVDSYFICAFYAFWLTKTTCRVLNFFGIDDSTASLLCPLRRSLSKEDPSITLLFYSPLLLQHLEATQVHNDIIIESLGPSLPTPKNANGVHGRCTLWSRRLLRKDK